DNERTKGASHVAPSVLDHRPCREHPATDRQHWRLCPGPDAKLSCAAVQQWPNHPDAQTHAGTAAAATGQSAHEALEPGVELVELEPLVSAVLSPVLSAVLSTVLSALLSPLPTLRSTGEFGRVATVR